MPPSEKMKLVDMQGSEVSVAHQCRLLNLSRSRLYYLPKGVPCEELEMMRLLDELYIQGCRLTLFVDFPKNRTGN